MYRCPCKEGIDLQADCSHNDRKYNLLCSQRGESKQTDSDLTLSVCSHYTHVHSLTDPHTPHKCGRANQSPPTTIPSYPDPCTPGLCKILNFVICSFHSVQDLQVESNCLNEIRVFFLTLKFELPFCILFATSIIKFT